MYIELVKKFHEIFNHPINYFKNFIELKVRQLRLKLIFEELKELSEASDVKGTFYTLCKEVVDNSPKVVDGNNVDKKEELDALCDIQYVLAGGILALGYQDVFDKAFEEVHFSNMSKMCLTTEELEATVKHYNDKNIETIVMEKDYGWIVLRKEDNKVLKNINYHEADLKQFVV